MLNEGTFCLVLFKHSLKLALLINNTVSGCDKCIGRILEKSNSQRAMVGVGGGEFQGFAA